MKKEVMTLAWEIARKGAIKFGGSVREYFKMALKQAWCEVKVRYFNKARAAQPVGHVVISFDFMPQQYCAEVTGKCKKWFYDRQFLTPCAFSHHGISYKLENGKYYELDQFGRRTYIYVDNGVAQEMMKEQFDLVWQGGYAVAVDTATNDKVYMYAH